MYNNGEALFVIMARALFVIITTVVVALIMRRLLFVIMAAALFVIITTVVIALIIMQCVTPLYNVGRPPLSVSNRDWGGVV